MFSIKSAALWVAAQFVFITYGYGQHIALKGRVVDKKYQPLEAAVVSGCGQPVTTGHDGNFALTTNKGRCILVVSFSGFVSIRIPMDIQKDTLLQDIILDFSMRHLDEVVIDDIHAGKKTNETLQTDIVNSNFIRRNMGGSLMQSLERLPGIKSISIGSSSSKPLIRGLGSNQVVVVESGVKHEGQQWGADHGLEIDQYRINRMEIVKGPASFIYGSDALAGAIDIKPLPKPAPNSLGGSIDLTTKSNNQLYGGSFNLYGRNQKWFFDARASYLNYADYRVPTDTVYAYSYAIPLLKRRVRNTAGMELNTFLSAGYVKSRFSSVFSISNNAAKSGFFANAHGLEPRNVDLKLQDASARDVQLPYQQVSHTKLLNLTAYSIGNHRIEINTGFQRNFRREFSQYVNHGYMPAVYPSSLGYPATLERQYDKDVWTLNAKDEIHFDKHSLSFGINTELQKNKIAGWGFLIPAFSQKTIGGYIYDKFFLNNKLMLQGALRYDYGNIQVKEYKDWFLTPIEEGGTTIDQYLIRANTFTKNFSSINWSTGINYTPGKITLTANIGTGFRMPIAKELAANGVNYHYFRYEKGNASLSPERSYQLDLGGGWKTQKVHIRFSPFLNYFSNYIYLNPTAEYDLYYGAGNQVFNYAEACVFRTGAELQAGYQFFNEWHLEAAGEYVYNQQLSGDKQGYTIPFTPPASALFTLTYEPAFKLRWLSEYYLSIDYRLAAAQNRIVPPEKKTPGYTVLSLSAGTRVKAGANHIQINLQAQNLLNKRYLNHTSFYRLIELPEMGRNIIVSVKIPFSVSK